MPKAENPPGGEPGGILRAALSNPLTVMRLIFSAGDALLAQASLHAQLARVEWAQEKQRLLGMLVAAAVGFVGILCFALFAGVLLLAFSWDTDYRNLVAILLLSAYAVAAATAWMRLRNLGARGSSSFAATREEVAADIALIRDRLGK